MKFLISIFLFLLIHTSTIKSQDFGKLADAVIAKDTLKILDLLENGIDINTRSESNDATILFLAASYKDYDDMVDLLIKNGADVNAKSKDGRTPLMWAAGNSYKSTQLLLDAGADVNAVAEQDNMNAVIQATFGILSKKISTDVIDLLLKNGAKIDGSLSGKDAAGWTALLFASVNEDYDLVKYLLDHGADVNHTSDEGQSALSLAKQQKNKEIIKLLHDRGALD